MIEVDIEWLPSLPNLSFQCRIVPVSTKISIVKYNYYDLYIFIRKLLLPSSYLEFAA